MSYWQQGSTSTDDMAVKFDSPVILWANVIKYEALLSEWIAYECGIQILVYHKEKFRASGGDSVGK